MSGVIKIIGAKQHNLKDLTLEIPRDALVVVTGLSAGTYIVEEISAPQGYVISDNAAKTVFLSGEDQEGN